MSIYDGSVLDTADELIVDFVADASAVQTVPRSMHLRRSLTVGQEVQYLHYIHYPPSNQKKLARRSEGRGEEVWLWTNI